MTTKLSLNDGSSTQEACNLLLQTSHRIPNYATRHSTVASEIFFEHWSDITTNSRDDSCDATDYSLPDRIQRLTQHYIQQPEQSLVENRCIYLYSLDDRKEESCMEARRIALTASISASAPRNFYPIWLDFFQKLLSAYVDCWEELQNLSEEEEVEGEMKYKHVGEYISLQGTLTISGLDWDILTFYENLSLLKWLDATNAKGTDILTRPLVQALHEVISKFVRNQISGEFEQDHLLSSLQNWKKSVLVPFFQSILGPKCYKDMNWDHKLSFIISQHYCHVRKDEIFDLVADFPDSLPAIYDLKRALEETRMTSQLIEALRDSFQRRLLHPGAQTSQVLQVYINTIKVLRVMDPTDSLIDGVADGIKSYLRGRSDTVRCIISSLTDEDSGGDLNDELQRHDAVPLEQAQYDSDDDDIPPDLNWTPNPSEYFQRTSGSTLVSDFEYNPTPADILSMLVGIYGTKDLFVDEYSIMLADKLLANTDFDTDKEVHNLELLKLRFGETSMRQCEIMIKDIDDSKRITSNIHSTLRGKSSTQSSSDTIVNAVILSHIFWPPLQKDTMKNHPRIQSLLDQFSTEYAKYKNPRRLVWFHQLGQVQVELNVTEEGADGELLISTKEFTCTPLQATLISHFEDNDGYWTATDLSNETSVSEDTIKKKMNFWINNNVIKAFRHPEGGVAYQLRSYQDSHSMIEGQNSSDMYDDDDEGFAVSLSVQEEEEIKAYESYIVAMLSNLGQLPLERIHNMLKMFVTGTEHRYNRTPQQLSMFLQQLCKEEKLEYGADGMYKLLKK